jgi:hypothetical protein
MIYHWDDKSKSNWSQFDIYSWIQEGWNSQSFHEIPDRSTFRLILKNPLNKSLKFRATPADLILPNFLPRLCGQRHPGTLIIPFAFDMIVINTLSPRKRDVSSYIFSSKRGDSLVKDGVDFRMGRSRPGLSAVAIDRQGLSESQHPRRGSGSRSLSWVITYSTDRWNG